MLVITFTENPTEEQLKMAEEFATAYQLQNPQVKVRIGSPVPPRK